MKAPDEIPAVDSGQADTRHFEQQLARAMRPVDAPQGFAHRLMERVAEEGAVLDRTASAEGVPVRSPDPSPTATRGRLLVMPRRQWMGWASGALAAMLVAGVFVGQHEYAEHQRRLAADREFEAATRITDQALEHTRQQLAQQGIDLDGQ